MKNKKQKNKKESEVKFGTNPTVNNKYAINLRADCGNVQEANSWGNTEM